MSTSRRRVRRKQAAERQPVGAVDSTAQETAANDSCVAVLICRGGKHEAPSRSRYEGASDCRAAALPFGATYACIYDCVGLGNCARVCPVSAITMDDNGLPVIDEKKCTGCGKCVEECPKQTLLLIPRSKLVVLACVSHDKGSAVKRVCRVGCIGCNICVEVCPTQALRMENNLPVMDFEKCIDCGICFRKCPTARSSTAPRAGPRPSSTPGATGVRPASGSAGSMP